MGCNAFFFFFCRELWQWCTFEKKLVLNVYLNYIQSKITALRWFLIFFNNSLFSISHVLNMFSPSEQHKVQCFFSALALIQSKYEKVTFSSFLFVSTLSVKLQHFHFIKSKNRNNTNTVASYTKFACVLSNKGFLKFLSGTINGSSEWWAVGLPWWHKACDKNMQWVAWNFAVRAKQLDS